LAQLSPVDLGGLSIELEVKGNGMADQISPVFRISARLQMLNTSAAILKVAGEIDLSTAHVLLENLELAARQGYRELVIDFTEVSFLDSSGLHALIEGRRLIDENGSAVVLVPSRPVRRLLELVSPMPLFDARAETVEQALGLLALDEWQKSG
jgi:anti-anti-sigma factor